jgi:hypothetical protein
LDGELTAVQGRPRRKPARQNEDGKNSRIARSAMKYLVLVKVRPDAQITSELAAAHKRAIMDQVEKRQAESVYIFAGRGVPHGMLILNAETPEELNALVLSAPGFSVCDLEVHPLADFAKACDLFIDVLKKPGGHRAVDDLGL